MCCNKCGSNLNKSVNYCPVCGAKTDDENISSAELLRRVFCEEAVEDQPRRRFGFKRAGSLLADAFAS